VATDVRPKVPGDTAWHPAGALPPVAFDHESIIGSARDRLRAKLSYTNLGFALAPATFTITRLREIYAAALGHPVAATNLQRILTRRGAIEPTPATARPTAAGGRPATLYRFADRSLRITNPFAAFRPPASQASEVSEVRRGEDARRRSEARQNEGKRGDRRCG
jgi:8-oxo-dGTP diphosphatase